jgi:CheY-like chemotaxis protein
MQLTLLIVDDDSDDVALFCDAVHEIDETYRCIPAFNGTQALELLEHAIIKPNFIFMDLNLPLMNGKECLSQIKSNPQFTDIPVIIYSTSRLQKDIEDVYKLGATNFLTKPSSFRDIIKKIAIILAEQQDKMTTRETLVN